MGAREIRAPRGTELSCRSWPQEAAMRMLMNNLDPIDGKKLQSAAQGNLDVSKLGEASVKAANELKEGEYKDLLARMQDVLKDRASQVRLTHRLTDSPACLVGDEHG